MALEVGSVVEGTVSGITNFGAFVDVGEEVTGLVHISEIGSGYVKEVSDVLQVGDAVKVKVLAVAEGKIGLSIKQALPPVKVRERMPERPMHASRGNRGRKAAGSLEDKISKFLKESDEKLSSLKRHTESKRGGRGGRRA